MSYNPKLESVGNYKIDSSLSGNRVKVYHNSKTNEAIIVHRGTKDWPDVFTDIKMAMGFKNTPRFLHAKKIQTQAEKKYENTKIYTIGHSLGGNLAESSNVNGKVITYNKFSMGANSKTKKSQIDIRSSHDPISYLSKENDYTLNSKPKNLFNEHSVNRLLDKID
jgi:hypothetical protein